MATFLAIPPTTTAGVVTQATALQRLPTAAGTPALGTAAIADSTTVTLSDAARVLSVINGTATDANAALGAGVNDGLAATAPAANDALAAERSAFVAAQALRALLDDPGLRAIKNQADPLYSALIAASHLSDFVPAAPTGVNPNAIAPDVPAPVRPVAVSRAIDFYRETAGETGRQMAA